MSDTQDQAVGIILDRLLTLYGPLLTKADLATELRVAVEALDSRRSRKRTGGMPEPLPHVRPQQFRAVELARWLAGSTASPVSPTAPIGKRGPGRPRKHADREGGTHESGRR